MNISSNIPLQLVYKELQILEEDRYSAPLENENGTHQEYNITQCEELGFS